MKHPKYDYEMMLPEAILKQTLESIEKELSGSQRGWLTQVYRGNVGSSPEVQADYAEARTYLMRIGYLPASEEPAPQPLTRARKGRGSY